MKKTIAIGIVLLLLLAVSTGCSKSEGLSNSAAQESDQTSRTEEMLNFNLPIIDDETVDNKVQIKAIYLTPQEGGQLSKQGIESYPEILMVNSFSELKENFQTNCAIWIDKGAVSIIDQTWLHEEPQMYCTLVLVGYNDAIYSFREKLTGFGIEGPYVDWSEQELEPGFSIWMLL